jgi:hypothetical protein
MSQYFEPSITREDLIGGKQLIYIFGNGYGASVIHNRGSYGYAEGLLELAVIKGTLEDWDICYDTPITDDVVGHLEGDEVRALLQQIYELLHADIDVPYVID